jgi:hypothetical protein
VSCRYRSERHSAPQSTPTNQKSSEVQLWNVEIVIARNEWQSGAF